jgi:hypothetical protein
MFAGQGYELEEGTYPLHVEMVAGVSIREEIQILLDAGWTWDRNKLVHPSDKSIWRMYTRVDSPKIGNAQRLDAEIEQAVRESRWQEQGKQSGGL